MKTRKTGRARRRVETAPTIPPPPPHGMQLSQALLLLDDIAKHEAAYMLGRLNLLALEVVNAWDRTKKPDDGGELHKALAELRSELIGLAHVLATVPRVLEQDRR